MMIKKLILKQKFKNLMRYRNTVEQGLTFNQIFSEVYSDVVEKYIHKKSDFSRLEVDAYNGFNEDVITSRSTVNYKTKANAMVDEFPR